MKLFLDCEFTQLTREAKLISLALVAESGDEFYVELTDTLQLSDCSDFVSQHVLPQLDAERYGLSLAEAQQSLWRFLARSDDQLEVCTDAPQWDWEFFCDLAYSNRRWPHQVINRPTDLIELFNAAGFDNSEAIELPDLPHHALLDARIIASLYLRLVQSREQSL